MPWNESCAMDERTRFIGDHLSGDWSMTELCEHYEISRKTGYKWLGHYAELGAAGLVELWRAPHVHGRATSQHLVDAIVGLRQLRKSSGGRARSSPSLSAGHPDVDSPLASTAGEILKRAGEVSERRFGVMGPRAWAS